MCHPPLKLTSLEVKLILCAPVHGFTFDCFFVVVVVVILVLFHFGFLVLFCWGCFFWGGWFSFFLVFCLSGFFFSPSPP